MTQTKSRIGEISLVIVPSTDQDRAIEFYEGVLGFEKRTDVPFGGDYRWVEVYPANGTPGSPLRLRARAARPQWRPASR
jgi:catechol 2,3-dioxygenase-like lactoylglutathione lyase family enzyme